MYGELKIDSKGRITLPRIMGFKDGDELILFMRNDYITILFPNEVESFAKEVLKDESIEELKRRRSIVRVFSSNCMSVKIDFSAKHGSRINLTKEVVSKYNLDNRLIYEIVDNHLRLWHPDKFEEYKASLSGSKGK